MNEAQEPDLLIQDCDCGSHKCRVFVVAIIHPVIKQVDDTDDLCAMAYVPIEYAQEIIDRIRQFANQKGVVVR